MKLENKIYKAGDKVEITLNAEMAQQLNVVIGAGFTEENCLLTSFTFKTREYSKLNKLAGNRTIKKTNIKAKKDLLSKNGFKSSNPVIINNNAEIIDGQHRRLAAQELGIPYKFTVDTDLTAENSLQATIELNNSGKPWGIVDYANAYAEIGNENYTKILELADELETNLSRVLMLYLDTKPSSQYTKDIFNKGRFVFKEKLAKEARMKKKELDIIAEATTNPTYKTITRGEGFWKAYLEIRRAENFKFKIIKEQFEKMRYTFLDPRELPRTLVQTYNYKRQANTQIEYNSLNFGGAGRNKKENTGE